ncbi:MAG: hypothetical protein ACR2QT_02965 [Woeseiaceae bacterium]
MPKIPSFEHLSNVVSIRTRVLFGFAVDFNTDSYLFVSATNGLCDIFGIPVTFSVLCCGAGAYASGANG